MGLLVFILKALWNQVGNEFDHICADVGVLYTFVKYHSYIGCNLYVKVGVLSQVGFGRGLSKEAGEGGQVVEEEGW